MLDLDPYRKGPSLLIGKVLVPVMLFTECNNITIPYTLLSVLKYGQDARIVQIGFSAVFDRVNQYGILNKLCSVDIIGSVLSILTQFLSNRSQHVMVYGCRSKLVNVVLRVPHGSVLAPLLLILYTSELFL